MLNRACCRAENHAAVIGVAEAKQPTEFNSNIRVTKNEYIKLQNCICQQEHR